jgi:hypothetical protein
LPNPVNNSNSEEAATIFKARLRRRIRAHRDFFTRIVPISIPFTPPSYATLVTGV